MAKVRAKKQIKGKLPEWRLPWFVWLAIGLGIVAIVAFVRSSPANKPVDSRHPGQLKAVVVDQPNSLRPN